MEMSTFIQNNRHHIDHVIRSVCSNCQIEDDDDREEWILNHEGLYEWARSEGVDV